MFSVALQLFWLRRNEMFMATIELKVGAGHGILYQPLKE